MTPQGRNKEQPMTHTRLARLSRYLQSRIDDAAKHGVFASTISTQLDVVQLAKSGDETALLAAAHLEAQITAHPAGRKALEAA
jgi:hypothetical protein